MNRVDGKGKGSLSHALVKMPAAISHLLACGADPRKQGSDWFAILVPLGVAHYIQLARVIHSVIKTNFAVRREARLTPALSVGDTKIELPLCMLRHASF